MLKALNLIGYPMEDNMGVILNQIKVLSKKSFGKMSSNKKELFHLSMIMNNLQKCGGSHHDEIGEMLKQIQELYRPILLEHHDLFL